MTTFHKTAASLLFILIFILFTVHATHQTTPSTIVEKSKVDVLGYVLKRHVEALRKTQNKQVELVFLVDSSASVGAENFFNELKFVKKLLADFTVEFNATRVAVITFSSRNRVVKHVDHVSNPSTLNHKCSLLEEQLPTITYQGGGTYTLGAVLQAQEVLDKARPNAAKAVFLVTDGYSNGGDPRPAAKALRDQNVEIFTFGIQNGNVKELYDMASDPPEEHSYILDSFEEFEALARRALHEDLHIGTYLEQDSTSCGKLCENGTNCCDAKALCTCGTHTGHYACRCEKGFYGTGLDGDCHACPAGTYKSASNPGDISSCISCPDPNHVSYPASMSLDQCRCKPGFMKEFDKCVAMACPVLKPPANGYFVNEECSYVFNAACGIRCNPGYKLKGSSIRICAENGTWTGDEVACHLKSCSHLNAPRNGFMNCSSEDNVFETECHFSCEIGFFLVGSKKRNCLAISLWDGLPALCRPVSCSALPVLMNGKLSPSKCTKGKSSYGEICSYECDSGFKLSVLESRICGDTGSWTDANKSPTCIDVEPPFIKCPEDIVVDAEESESNVLVRWLEPITTDNSDDPVVVTVVPAIVSPRRFDIGIASVTYTASDRAGNKARCTFTITVRDVQPPTVDRCNSPPIALSRVLPMEVGWDEPMFSDNSGQTLDIVSSHRNPSFFQLGTSEVVYEVKDNAGNNNTCVITVTVREHACAFPDNPTHGNANCSEADTGVFCSLSCEDGYGFALKIPQFYFCAYDGIWEPVENLPFPDCSYTFYSNSISKIGTMSVSSSGMSCRDNFLLAQLEKHLERKISNQVSRICRSNIICEVENMIAECESSRDKEEEDTNVIYRRRRSSSSNVTVTQDLSSELQDEEVLRIVPSQTDQRPDTVSYLSEQTVHNKIELEFQLTGKLPENSEERDEQNSLLNSLQTAMQSLEDAANKGELDLSLGNNKLHVEYVKFSGDEPNFICESGTVAQDNICVKCPVGTFFNVISETCEACPQGTYQFQEGEFTCLVCPEKTSTTTGQSKSLGECKAQCLPGTFSSNGLEPCETCPLGFYQPLYAQFYCLSCPSPKTTHRRGVRNVLECRAPCSPGRVSRIGLQPCFPCPDGYFQPHEGAKSCFKCPENLRTGIQGAVNVSACKGLSVDTYLARPLLVAEELTINDCFSVPCQHGASCKALDIGFLCLCIPGYTGIYCEKEINECETTPCLHGGTCKDHINGYTCFCSLGYAGEHCDLDVDDCLHEPCFNGATCFDEINGYHCKCTSGFVGPLCQYNIDECISNPCRNGGFCVDLIADYMCDCMPGFEGRHCEINIDDCASNPCKNNATCKDDILYYRCDCLPGFEGPQCEMDIDECKIEPCMNAATCIDEIANFKCLCPPSFAGDLCETELSSDFLLHFPSSGILDFVQLDSMPRLMSATTVCMWMLTNDKVNYGTPMSYAADNNADNLLTLTDYSGFVFYVNMEKVVTDVTANDGKWHHICVTWSSINGSWSLYKDGKKEDSGDGLATGTLIPATGTLVLGQEQDRRGAGFNSPESFIGTLALLNIWDQVLDSSTITSFITRCDNYRGNIRSWADFKAGVRGKVQQKSSSFCQGCQAPPDFSNGEIVVSGMRTLAVASYICSPGYEVQGVSSRRCLSSGDWSDVTPKCARISCGFPGYIANGYINGRQYHYLDTIHYVCNPGYRLQEDATRTCQADARWSGTAPNCDEIVCKAPNVLENGYSLTSQIHYRLNELIYFDCEDGYQLDGANSLSCSNDGHWNDTLAICQPKSCESPPRVPHGSVVGPQTKLDVGSVVYYECDEGFEMKQSGKMYCELKNRWAGDLPRCERIICGEPSIVTHSSYEGKDYKFGGTITYKCDRGYELYGQSSSTCQSDGAWSASPPECVPIRCNAVLSPEHGGVDIEDLTYGSVAKYFCHTGYELQGVRSRKCRASGDWSSEAPYCVPMSCSQPESISNGRYMGSDWTIGNTVTYTCNPGYILIGESDRVCLETGYWLHQVPSCEPVECSDPDPIEHGFVKFDDKRFGQRATYSCDVGHHMMGQPVRVCMEDQNWEPDVPECRPISCGPPPQGENMFVTASSDLYIATASYTCKEGFRLDGPNTRTCLASGKWSPREPMCDLIQCPEPAPVPHAYFINSDTRYGSVVEYFCDEGYKLQGPVQRICSGDGVWSREEPQCVRVQCPIPSSPNNGEVIVHTTFHKSVITYNCHRGYELKGQDTRTCLQDEMWNGTDPECEVISCAIEDLTIKNGKILGEKNIAGATIEYECDIGYVLTGDITRTCQEDRIWSGNKPHCFKIQCAVPAIPEHAEVKWTGHSFQDTVSHTCEEGYVLKGSSIRTCLPDGTWSGTEPTCPPVECEPVSKPNNGHITSTSSTYGSVAEYRCDQGYRLKGAKRRYCKADRSWSEKEPKCQIITCSDPPIIPYGSETKNKERYVVGSELEYKCNEGFVLRSIKTPVTCDMHGKWIGRLPICDILHCPSLPALRFGYIEGDNFTYGNVIHFTCNIEFQLIGEVSLTCRKDGQWDGPFPMCIGTQCQPPKEIENGYVTAKNFSNGATISYYCATGYEMVGTFEHKCLNDNTWSSLPPKCQPVICAPPRNTSHATILGTLYEYGDTVSYVCDKGYQLHGTRQLSCTENKTWSSDPPVCEQVSCSLPDSLVDGEIVVHSFSQGGAGRHVQNWQLGLPRGDITVDGKTVLETARSDIFHFGDKVTYRCTSGYKLVGSIDRTCQENGSWSHEVPKCDPVKCKVPEDLMMGDIAVTSLVYKSRANYTCGNGYKIVGPTFRECQANATWTLGSPACVVIVCPSVQNISHGYAKWTSLKYGSSVTYECTPGYKVVGTPIRQCGDSGKWSKHEPTCIANECAAPESPDDGWVEAENIIVGSTATYYCNDGYELHGTLTRTCLTNESWSSETPKCAKISCVEPSEIQHGSFKGSDYAFGSTIKYECDEGYHLDGSAILKCLSNKMWSKLVPTCEPLPCPRPVPPAHGTVLFRTLLVGSTVHFSCKEGYKILGQSSSTCLKNQTWDSNPPACEMITCVMPKMLKHGKIIGSNSTYQSTLTFQCHPKYKLEGPDTIHCTVYGNWSKSTPKCLRHLCEDPPKPKNSTFVLGPHIVGHVIVYECSKGYILNGQSRLVCDQNGHWQGDLPYCEPVDCGIPPKIPHSKTILKNGTKLDAVASYVCEDGHKIVGRFATCNVDGIWSTVPSCEEVNCVDPPSIAHSTYFVNKIPGITEVIYTCETGYKMTGAEKHVCLGDDSWKIHGISCDAIKCAVPPSIPHGATNGSTEAVYGSIQFYHCFPGYRLVGNFEIQCSAYGIWEGKLPHCVPISCPVPVAPQHGSIKGKDFFFESAVTYSCNKGFQIFGRDTRFCLEDGTWSGQEPHCRRISCGEIKAPEDGYIIQEKSTEFGDHVVFACHDGYDLVGSDEIHCMDSGKWNRHPPVCTPLTCEAPSLIPPNAASMDLMKYRKFKVNQRITYHCESGFMQHGDLSIQCLANRTWTSVKGNCKKVSCGRPKMNNGAVVLGMSYLFQDNLVVVCPPGTKSKGKTVLSCKSNGEWDGQPSCEGMCSRTCLNGGMCVPPGLCSCPSGYVGDVCQHAVCILPCLNGGTCIGPYNCACLPGFAGTRCQTATSKRRGRMYRGR